MYHLHTLRHMSYVYLWIFLRRQGNTSINETIFLYSGCGRVVQGAGHKVIGAAVYQWCEFKSCRGKNKICQLKDLPGISNTGLIFRLYILFVSLSLPQYGKLAILRVKVLVFNNISVLWCLLVWNPEKTTNCQPPNCLTTIICLHQHQIQTRCVKMSFGIFPMSYVHRPFLFLIGRFF